MRPSFVHLGLSSDTLLCTSVYCYKIDGSHQFLMADYRVSCIGGMYRIHNILLWGLVVLIPVGIPVGVGLRLWKYRKKILEGKGPHAMENLYKDYKPQCCMWEIYQMLQKCALPCVCVCVCVCVHIRFTPLTFLLVLHLVCLYLFAGSS